MYCQNSAQQLLHRSICRNGNQLISPPLDTQTTEATYRSVLQDLDLLKREPEERIRCFTKVPSKKLIHKTSLSGDTRLENR